MLPPHAIKTLMFVCHGNICRSPMAECRMAQLLQEAGIDGIAVDSCATSTEEIGNDIHPGARRALRAHNVPLRKHAARQLTQADARPGTLFIAMDQANIRNILRMVALKDDTDAALLLDFAGRNGQSIADPWYTGDFDETWNDIDQGCRALLDYLNQKLQAQRP